MQQEWVEVRGPSVEEAVQAGLQELGIGSIDQAEIEVIQEPKRRFLVRVQDAVVRIKAKPAKKKRRRRRRRGGGSGEEEPQKSEQRAPKQQQRRDSGRTGRPKGAKDGQKQGSSRSGSRSGSRGPQQRKPARDHQGGSVATDSAQQDSGPAKPEPEEQAEVAVSFLQGLLDAFGLEGDVASKVEEGVIYVDVTGEQTEALVGPKGSIMQAILELSRTVVQRKTFGGARLRLDIAGYGARRREALQIYAARLAGQVKADGEEVMLEPMNPADRKVVHDAVAEIDGVRTYSEGEEPNRSVIISLSPGVEPAGTGSRDDAEDEAPAEESDESE